MTIVYLRSLYAFALLFALPIAAIASELDFKDLLARNNASLARLSMGMTKAQVVETMGSSSALVRDGIVTNPWRVEAFTRDGAIYEVLYYVVLKNRAFRPIREDLTTPVVLKDGVVVGWGRNALP